MTKINAKTATVSISLSPELLNRVDQAAHAHQQTRSAYILSWLPEQQHLDEPPQENGAKQQQREPARGSD